MTFFSAYIYALVTEAVNNNNNSNSTNNSGLINFIKRIIEQSIEKGTTFENLSAPQKNLYCDLFAMIYLTNFSQDEVTDLKISSFG